MSSPDLTELDFFENNLNGSISGLSGHSSLVVFDVRNNQMSGKIPDDYSTSMRNLYVLSAANNQLYGFLPDSFATSSIPYFDFSYNKLYCPLPNVSKYSATCQYWHLEFISPSSCTVGQMCYVTLIGTDFNVDENVQCAFDSLKVPGKVASVNEITCSLVPKVPGRAYVSIIVDGKPVTLRSVFIEFKRNGNDNNNPAPVIRRSEFDPVHVRIHGESKCPDFGSIITIFQNITHILGPDIVDLQIGFIMTDIIDYSTGYWSLHGQSEVIGNALIKCVESKYNITTAVDFAACLAEEIDTVPTNAAACAKRFDIDYDDIRACPFTLDGKKLLKRASDLARYDGAVWSPTVIINDKLYCLWHSTPCNATRESDFLRDICKLYEGPTPAACP